jgi:hypothetical protein
MLSGNREEARTVDFFPEIKTCVVPVRLSVFEVPITSSYPICLAKGRLPVLCNIGKILENKH